MRALFSSRLMPIAAVAVIVAVLPAFFPSTYYYRVAALVLVFALAGIGLNLLMGFAGQVSLGHAGFIGIGAYAVAVGPSHLGLPPWLSFFVGAALSAVVAFLVGRPILRLKGHYLAVATLGFGILLSIVFTNEASITGGPDGMPVPRLVLFGWAARGSEAWYWISAVSFVIGTALALNLIDSPTGRALRAIHDSEVAARVLGIDVNRMVLYTFVINAVLAAVAALLITPAYLGKFDMGDSIGQKAFFAAIVGGFNQTRGALFGGVLIGVLENLVGFYLSPAYKEGVALILFLVVILFRPEGLLGKPEERKV